MRKTNDKIILRSKSSRKLFWLLFILLILTAVSQLAVAGLYSGYVAADDGKEDTRTAAFVFYVDDSGTQEYLVDIADEINKPGDSVTYTFTVQNYREGDIISEVAQNYMLTLEENGGLPVTCILETVDSEKKCSQVATVTADGVGKVKDSYLASMNAGERVSQEYKLTVEWPLTENDVAYSVGGMTGQVQLTMTSAQED